ncbi:hypothetical protein ACX35A_002312 [Enterococcus faecalis]|uniref:Uncharacterized protein n=1 Tax=Enterococcus faecalis ATCC 6055 TaxID=1169311 RepID=R3KJ15_ENTFL|nr:hypothetical protein [Enterococcus faecalis]EGO5055061.1 hypothetical protein [Enterococcus faecalis]EGO6585376.1 hypothetical protein [Enterococcus faecalis]EGO7851860.1 hypothetical protein [Enterococcus faecalis]EGO8094336.1 hypothetical protein [Enterococcus faecalis]EGO8357729.1 hypothetical protein [Enterococcus faecalis]
MLSLSEKWKLYISSYLPLYFLLLVKEYKHVIAVFTHFNTSGWASLFVCIMIATFLYSIYLIRKIFFGKPIKTFNISGEFEQVADNVMSYVMTYIVPVISVDFSEPVTLLTNILLFIFIGIVYVKNDLIYLNPVISVSHNIYINEKDIVISKYSLGELQRFNKEHIRMVGKKLSSNVILYQEIKSEDKNN